MGENSLFLVLNVLLQLTKCLNPYLVTKRKTQLKIKLQFYTGESHFVVVLLVMDLNDNTA